MKHERYTIEGDTYSIGTDDLGLRTLLIFGIPITETYIANKVFDDEICAEEDWLIPWELFGGFLFYFMKHEEFYKEWENQH